MVAWMKPAKAGSLVRHGFGLGAQLRPDRIAARQFFARDRHGLCFYHRNLRIFKTTPGYFPELSCPSMPKMAPSSHRLQRATMPDKTPLNLPAPQALDLAPHPPLRLGQGDGRARALQETAGRDPAGGGAGARSRQAVSLALYRIRRQGPRTVRRYPGGRAGGRRRTRQTDRGRTRALPARAGRGGRDLRGAGTDQDSGLGTGIVRRRGLPEYSDRRPCPRALSATG